MTRKARFVWADGYVDHRRVFEHAAAWRRLRWDREDVDLEKRYDLLSRSLNLLGSAGTLPEVEVVEFERVRYNDGSFEFRERCGG